MTIAEPASLVLGSTYPRLLTSPLVSGAAGPCGCGCALTSATSYGFDVEDFARDVLKRPLDPWQRWLVIHAGELLPDGLPRFRQVLVLVARQNGKTEVLVILTLYWLYVERVRLALGTSTNLDYARESWEKAVTLAESIDALAREIPRNGVRRANGEQTLATVWGGRYKIAASNRKGGRSLTIDRLVMDELREHHDWTAYSAAVPATNAVEDAQVWMITNQGDDRAVVLTSLRDQALRAIQGEAGDERLGLFEWSAPDGADADDVTALAMANPALGRRISLDALIGDARRAKLAGGEQLAAFLTEVQCRRVAHLDPAIDEEAWRACVVPGDLAALRDRVALCLDLSLDGLHASLFAAAVQDDGRVRVEPVQAWTGTDCTAQLRRDLPALVSRVAPRSLGWFPAGPAAAVAADMAERAGWPPAGVTVEALRNDAQAVCMGFAEQVTSRQLVHGDDPLLNSHVGAAEKRYQGDGWRFVRRGVGHVDALYAAAGAVHLARTLPPEEQKAGAQIWV